MRLAISLVGTLPIVRYSIITIIVTLPFVLCLHLEESACNLLTCREGDAYNTTLTAYFPDYNSDNMADFSDIRGKKLGTLQDFLDGRVSYVTAGMDRTLRLPYGTRVCIEQLNQHYGRHIPLEIRDTDPDYDGEGFSRIDICVRTEPDSYDLAVNKPVIIILEKY